MEDEAFWLRHLRLGIRLFAVGVLIALVYVAFGDPEREATMWWLAAVAAAQVVVVALLPHRAIVRSTHRSAFFHGWTVFSTLFVLVVVAVDGGASSPVSIMLILPVTYSSLAYQPVAVAAAAVGAGAGYGLVAAFGPDAPVGMVVMLTGTLLCIGMTATSVAIGRQQALARMTELHRQLEETARRDALTGCLTRAAFHEALGAELARGARAGRPTTLVMIDLDDFKDVNDTMGHLAGDAVLADVGRVLRSSLRAGDEAGRLGGDELAVFLPATGEAAGVVAATRILDDLADAGVRASIGLACADPTDDDLEPLLSRADAALYEAKRRGKGQVVTASEAAPRSPRRGDGGSDALRGGPGVA